MNQETVQIRRTNSPHKEHEEIKWNRFIEDVEDDKEYTFYSKKSQNGRSKIVLTGAELKEFRRCRTNDVNEEFYNRRLQFPTTWWFSRKNVVLYINAYSIYYMPVKDDRQNSNHRPYYEYQFNGRACHIDPDKLETYVFGGNTTNEGKKTNDNRIHHVDGYEEAVSTTILTCAQHQKLHSLDEIYKDECGVWKLPSLKEEVSKLSEMNNQSPKIVCPKSGKGKKDCDMAELPCKMLVSEVAASQLNEIMNLMNTLL